MRLNTLAIFLLARDVCVFASDGDAHIGERFQQRRDKGSRAPANRVAMWRCVVAAGGGPPLPRIAVRVLVLVRRVVLRSRAIAVVVAGHGNVLVPLVVVVVVVVVFLVLVCSCGRCVLQRHRLAGLVLELLCTLGEKHSAPTVRPRCHVPRHDHRNVTHLHHFDFGRAQQAQRRGILVGRQLGHVEHGLVALQEHGAHVRHKRLVRAAPPRGPTDRPRPRVRRRQWGARVGTVSPEPFVRGT